MLDFSQLRSFDLLDKMETHITGREKLTQLLQNAKTSITFKEDQIRPLIDLMLEKLSTADDKNLDSYIEILYSLKEESTQIYDLIPTSDSILARTMWPAWFEYIQTVMDARNNLRANLFIESLNQVKCSFCSGTQNLSNCGRCRKVKYCSKDCQKKDWKNHKSNCKP